MIALIKAFDLSYFGADSASSSERSGMSTFSFPSSCASYSPSSYCIFAITTSMSHVRDMREACISNRFIGIGSRLPHPVRRFRLDSDSSKQTKSPCMWPPLPNRRLRSRPESPSYYSPFSHSLSIHPLKASSRCQARFVPELLYYLSFFLLQLLDPHHLQPLVTCH